MNKAIRAALMSGTILMLAGAAGAVESGLPMVGVRAQGMGNAFVAVADDVNAVYWNPAGLGLVNHNQVMLDHADLYGLGIDQNNISFAQPQFGLAWRHLDASDFLLGSAAGEEFTQDTFTVAGAYRVDKQTLLGAALKFHKQEYTAPNKGALPGRTITSALDVSGDGFSADLGGLYLVDSITTVGLLAQDVFGEISSNNSTGTVDNNLDPRISVGFSRRPDEQSLYSIQLSDLGEDTIIHLGAEKFIQENLNFRLGLEDEIFTAGLGFAHEDYRLDYSFKNDAGGGLDETQRLSVTVGF